MWNIFKKAAFKFFGNSLDFLVKYFEDIKEDLEKSGLQISLHEYVYIMIFCTFLTFIIEFPLFAFIAGLFFPPIFAFFISLTTSIVICLGIFFFFYTYPAFLTSKRAKEIEAALPFVSIYLSSLAASGMPPASMFKLLSEFKEYKEVSKEAYKIWRDIDYFGMSIDQAIRKAVLKTPSKEFKEMLLGLLSVLSSGVDLTNYFMQKSKEFMSLYRRKLESFSKTLTLLVEIYLTLITVGSIFFIVLSVVMSAFSPGSAETLLLIQFFIVFLLLPLISIGFIIGIRLLSPGM
ncbi:MAG TPA: hypothetical protein EYH56_01340 [Nanoarchaeota archaeon]|nr:hypothetical protein [Nanoarchaeota archaeon]